MLKKKLKIAIFHFGLFYSGGGERLVLEEAIGLEKEGYDVTLFAPIVDTKKCFPELISKVKVKKILPKILPGWFPDNVLISILAACIFVPFFYNKYKKFDIYFGANQPGPWISYILSKINKKPYVIYLAQPTRLVHPRLIDQKVGLKLTDGFTLLGLLALINKPVIKYLDGISIRGAKQVFVNGSYMSGVIKEVYSVPPVNCPAGANADQKYMEKEKKSLLNSNHRFRGNILFNKILIRKPYILITNRHFPHKKFEYAIEALSLLPKKIPLVITGAPTEYTAFLKRKYRNKNIIFTGLLNEKELNTAYAAAAIYIYPAPEEDFGMGILEAMAHGAPVVAWGNAGPTGIVEHGTDGLLAKPFQIEDLALQITKLLGGKRLYRKIVSRAAIKVRELFSYERHVKILDYSLKKILRASYKSRSVYTAKKKLSKQNKLAGLDLNQI